MQAEEPVMDIAHLEATRTEEDCGHGPGYRFRDSDGHVFELSWETQWHEPPRERNRARGVNVRRIHHFNGLAVDVRACREFFPCRLGLRGTERIELDDGTEAGMWLTADRDRGRTSMRCSRPSSSMSSNPAAIAWKSRMRARG
jgi:hypothetical protein